MNPDSCQLAKIGAAMAASAPEGWRSITLRVSAVSSTVQTSQRIELSDGTVDESQGVGPDGHFALDDLRDSMYQEGVGTWYTATFTLTSDGQLETDFDYDEAPFDGDFTPEMLEDDQEAYPRSPENLPAWHPSRP